MSTIVWALLGVAVICGTCWGNPVGVTTLNTNLEARVSDASSSSEEVVNILEEKLTDTTEVDEGAVEETKDHTSQEEVKPPAEENEEGVAAERGVENDGGESPVENVTSSPLRSSTDSTEQVEEGEERSSDVQDS